MSTMPSLIADVPVAAPTTQGILCSRDTTALAIESSVSRRHGHLADHHVAGLDFAGLGEVKDDLRPALNGSGRGADGLG